MDCYYVLLPFPLPSSPTEEGPVDPQARGDDHDGRDEGQRASVEHGGTVRLEAALGAAVRAEQISRNGGSLCCV